MDTHQGPSRSIKVKGSRNHLLSHRSPPKRTSSKGVSFQKTRHGWLSSQKPHSSGSSFPPLHGPRTPSLSTGSIIALRSKSTEATRWCPACTASARGVRPSLSSSPRTCKQAGSFKQMEFQVGGPTSLWPRDGPSLEATLHHQFGNCFIKATQLIGCWLEAP